jgi:hypothetical protein
MISHTKHIVGVQRRMSIRNTAKSFPKQSLIRLNQMNKVIEYALNYLKVNWDEFIEDDLGMGKEHFEMLLRKFQKSIDNPKGEE